MSRDLQREQKSNGVSCSGILVEMSCKIQAVSFAQAIIKKGSAYSKCAVNTILEYVDASYGISDNARNQQ